MSATLLMLFGIYSLFNAFFSQPLLSSSWSRRNLAQRGRSLFRKPVVFPESARLMWQDLLPLIHKYHPGVSPSTGRADYDIEAEKRAYDAHNAPPLTDALTHKSSEVLKMKEAHEGYVNAITNRFSASGSVIHGSGRGIVMVGGGQYTAVALVSLRMLRRTGSTLPVEVWLPDVFNYDKTICDNVLPSMNARCMLLTDVFDFVDVPNRQMEVVRYQYKVLALIFSTFDDLLFLDADNFPVRDPEYLFDSQPYLSTGLVTWPDVWESTISPEYYVISSQPADTTNAIASTEAGQLLINKRNHHLTLLLSLYYNYYGPDFYYLMLCQQTTGIGDKTTFVSAAVSVNETFYQVREKPILVWGLQDDNKTSDKGLLQFDPAQDYNLTSHGLDRGMDEGVAPQPDLMFVHFNTPKWNPRWIVRDINNGHEYDMESAGPWKPRLYVGPEKALPLIEGIERTMLGEAQWVGCSLQATYQEFMDDPMVCTRIHALLS